MRTIGKAEVQKDVKSSDPDRLQKLGDYFASVNRYEKAESCYQKAIEIDPENPLVYVGLADIALVRGDRERAERYLDNALELDPECSAAYAQMAKLARKTGNYPLAFDAYLRCLKLDTDNLNALLGLFQVSCQMGSFAKVTFYLEQYLNSHPDDTSVMFCLGALYKKDNRLLSAQQILNSLLKLDPGNQDAKNLLEEIEHNIFQKLS